METGFNSSFPTSRGLKENCINPQYRFGSRVVLLRLMRQQRRILQSSDISVMMWEVSRPLGLGGRELLCRTLWQHAPGAHTIHLLLSIWKIWPWWEMNCWFLIHKQQLILKYMLFYLAELKCQFLLEFFQICIYKRYVCIPIDIMMYIICFIYKPYVTFTSFYLKDLTMMRDELLVLDPQTAAHS